MTSTLIPSDSYDVFYTDDTGSLYQTSIEALIPGTSQEETNAFIKKLYIKIAQSRGFISFKEAYTGKIWYISPSTFNYYITRVKNQTGSPLTIYFGPDLRSNLAVDDSDRQKMVDYFEKA